MKLSLRVGNIKKASDVTKVRTAITTNEGILACEITDKGSISIVYDNYLTSEEDIIDAIEECGYIVIDKV
ncbi:heavy-metal-associated domain-containing protein [Inconstantimicrobium mannanitabidum]|uniref:Uncharacterized protein n=1 Tax=Inconstantimicrobium mannanitabidum TaxID=1604901 RepID=A0ACB5RI22_9CLOT|nr:heavy-metal-associated domain-containing protein [Clostridium sp. TW13]GKX68756.1 hypothetical protein rsdtw13_40140 [Clostridium sp. TW13]